MRNSGQRLALLDDAKSFEKFCSKNDRVFGCKEAFMCGVSCPLYLAREVQMLANEKGMTIGEAHRACMRAFMDPTIGHEIIREAVIAAGKGRREYPEAKEKIDRERREVGPDTPGYTPVETSE